MIPARVEPRRRGDIQRAVTPLGGLGGRAGRRVGARARVPRGRGGVAAPGRRHLAHAPTHVSLLPRGRRRLPVRADAGRLQAGGGRDARPSGRDAALDPVRAHRRVHHADRSAVRGLSVRQEAAVQVLGMSRPGRVGAQHRAGTASRVRGGSVRGGPGRLAPRD